VLRTTVQVVRESDVARQLDVVDFVAVMKCMAFGWVGLIKTALAAETVMNRPPAMVPVISRK